MASTTETKGEPTEAPTVSPAPRAGPGSIIPGPSVEGRGGKAFVIFCAQATQNFLTNNSMQMAAAIAFYSFFSLFPLAFLTLLAFDLFVGNAAGQEEQVNRIISTFIPVSQDVVNRSIDSAAGSRQTIGPLALIGLIWASTAVFATLRKGINTAWNVWIPRPFLKERVIDLTLTTMAGLLFMGLVIAMTVVRTYVETDDLSSSPGLLTSPVWLTASSFGVTFFAFMLLYRFLPNRPVHLSDVVFGALIGAVAFELAKGAFFAYTQGREEVTQIYGSLTSVAVLLGWLYVSGAIILIGALIASIYTQLLQRKIVTATDIWTFGAAPGAKIAWRWSRARVRARLPNHRRGAFGAGPGEGDASRSR